MLNERINELIKKDLLAVPLNLSAPMLCTGILWWVKQTRSVPLRSLESNAGHTSVITHTYNYKLCSVLWREFISLWKVSTFFERKGFVAWKKEFDSPYIMISIDRFPVFIIFTQKFRTNLSLISEIMLTLWSTCLCSHFYWS